MWKDTVESTQVAIGKTQTVGGLSGSDQTPARAVAARISGAVVAWIWPAGLSWLTPASISNIILNVNVVTGAFIFVKFHWRVHR